MKEDIRVVPLWYAWFQGALHPKDDNRNRDVEPRRCSSRVLIACSGFCLFWQGRENKYIRKTLDLETLVGTCQTAYNMPVSTGNYHSIPSRTIMSLSVALCRDIAREMPMTSSRAKVHLTLLLTCRPLAYSYQCDELMIEVRRCHQSVAVMEKISVPTR